MVETDGAGARAEADDGAEARVARFLAGPTGGKLRTRRVERLVGDASTRVYFRVHLEEAGTVILALLPEAFEKDELEFLQMAKLFRDLGVTVPEVRDVSGAEAVLVLEDLGDVLLQDAVASATEEKKRELYEKSVDLIAGLQRAAAERLSNDPSCVPQSFDERKFTDELVFFADHFLEGLRGASLGTSERESLFESFRRLSRGRSQLYI